MNHEKTILRQRRRRRFRVRKPLRGSSDRPRLSIFRSHKHIYAQVIDDDAGRTLASASTMDKEARGGAAGNKEAAGTIGRIVAERALAAGVKQVTLDRGSCKYHGRVAALADAAREAGLQF